MTKLGRKRIKPLLELPRTPVSAPPSGGLSNTGTWRTYRPIKDEKECTKCRICWLYCPEGAIKINESGYPGIDLNFCKGCGICAKECPVKAIKMKYEGEMKSAQENSHDR